MTVVFFDKKRDVYVSITGVLSLESHVLRDDGQWVAFWMLDLGEKGAKSFRQKDYSVWRINAKGGNEQ